MRWVCFGALVLVLGCGAASPTSTETPKAEDAPAPHEVESSSGQTSSPEEPQPNSIQSVPAHTPDSPPEAPPPAASSSSSAALAPGESSNEKVPGANLSIANATVDGLTAENISCRMEGAMVLLGAVLVTAWMAPEKSKLDACGPKGMRIGVSWKVEGGRLTMLKASGEPKRKACVERALSGAKTPVEGHCAATIVLGTK